MNKKRKIAGKKRKKKIPPLVLSQIFFIRLKPFFFFDEFSHVECVPEKFN